MPGTASISGIVSGLSTDQIIAKIMELERVPITRLEARQATLTTKLTAWQDANTRILALKIKADLLATGSTCDAKTLTSGDETIVTGSASADAQAGIYVMKVNALARAHQLKTQGYADTNSTSTGTGTVGITVGSGEQTNITIDDTNDTLEGLRDAINNSGAGVTATIIDEGTGASPYRLIVTSNTSGTDGQVTIDVNLTGGTAPTFSDMQAAQNASITLGEGAGAITVERGTNEITDLIPGVTLNLQSADTSKTVTITIEADVQFIKQNIQDFVAQYNNLIDFINDQFYYNTETNTAGTLFADSNLQSIQSDVRSKISNPVTGLSQSIKVLSQIGITSTSDDKLSINQTDLDEALTGGVGEVKRLFATVGEPTHADISYVSSTDKTQPSEVDGYAIQITATASKSRVTAGAAQTTTLGQDESLVVNGILIELTSGMTQTQVVEEINKYTTQTAVVASATDSNGSGTGNYLTLMGAVYGSAPTITGESNVSNGGGSPEPDTSGIGTVEVTESNPVGETGTGTGAAGIDVAGTINGESATGVGQMLTGDEDNENTEGLKIKVTATSTGSYGSIRFTKGMGTVLGEYLVFITEPDTGTVMTAQDTLQDQIDDIVDEIADLEVRLTSREERLYRQFTAMENALSKLEIQGMFLTQQIALAANSWKK